MMRFLGIALSAFAVTALLTGCSTPPPPAPLIRQEYPTKERPFVYDVERAGYLICGGKDGKQEIPLKLPSNYSALKFNFDDGILFILCAKDNELTQRIAYIYDANATCLVHAKLPRQPAYGEVRHRVWLSDRGEALLYIAEGFSEKKGPHFAGVNPETYYLNGKAPAKAIGIGKPYAACIAKDSGYAVAFRKNDKVILARYSPKRLIWQQRFPVRTDKPTGAGVRPGKGKTDIEFAIYGRRHAFDAEGNELDL